MPETPGLEPRGVPATRRRRAKLRRAEPFRRIGAAGVPGGVQRHEDVVDLAPLPFRSQPFQLIHRLLEMRGEVVEPEIGDLGETSPPDVPDADQPVEHRGGVLDRDADALGGTSGYLGLGGEALVHEVETVDADGIGEDDEGLNAL